MSTASSRQTLAIDAGLVIVGALVVGALAYVGALSTLQLVLFVVGFPFAAVAALALLYVRRTEASINAEILEADADAEHGTVLEFPPDVSPGTRISTAIAILKSYRERKKKRTLLSKGYVQWFLIKDGWPRPRFVKPKPKNGGIPEIEHNDQRYLFPPGSRMPTEEQGIWTYIHREGESEPVVMNDPFDLAIPSDVLNDYLTRRTTSSAPSWLSNLNLDPKRLLMLLIIGIIAYAFLTGMMNGGIA